MWFSSAKRESKDVIYKNQPYKAEGTKPNNRSYSVHTSKVTYGGADGAYYTSTRTRRAGSDGVSVILWESESGLFSVILLFFNFIFGFLKWLVDQVVVEETKEADKTNGQAAHRISRGIHDKVTFALPF